jgi:site-specific DNA recombinase
MIVGVSAEQPSRRMRLAPTPARRALGYIRVSTMHEEKVSPEIQRASIEDWCRSNNVHLGEVISDLDISGKTFARQGIQRAVREVEQGRWDLVVVWKWSRFGRNLKDSLVNIDRLEAVGGELVATTEDFDTSHYLGKFQRGQMLLLAEMEAGRIGSNWKEAGDRRVRNGLPRTGQPRFGYTYHRSHYAPDPETGPLVVAAYEQYLAGQTLIGICAWLTAAGGRTVRGGMWQGSTLGRYLDSGFPAGLVHEGGFWRNGRLVPERWRDGAHEPLIDAALWEAYRRKRRDNATLSSHERRPKYMLSGLVRCAVCGRAMGVSDGWKEPARRFRCGGRAAGVCAAAPPSILRLELEQKVHEWLVGQATADRDRDLVARLGRQSKSAVARTDAALLEKEQLRLSEARKRLAVGYATGRMDAEPYFAADADLKEQEAGVTAALTAARDQAAAAAAAPSPAQIKTVLQGWDALTVVGQRETLRSLIREIRVWPRGADRQFRIIPHWEHP